MSFDIMPASLVQDVLCCQDRRCRFSFGERQVVAGDPLWQDYVISASWMPLTDKGQSGVILRYKSDRCYYFLGVFGGLGILKYVKDGDAFRKPHEEVLAKARLDWSPGAPLQAVASLEGNTIHARLADVTLDEARCSADPRVHGDCLPGFGAGGLPSQGLPRG